MAAGTPSENGQQEVLRPEPVKRPGRLIGWMRALSGVISRLHPSKFVLFGYLSYVLIGWGLLCLPFAQKGPGVGALDNLFIATSAVSTTGLATVSISDSYNFFGQLVVLGLIQLGGIGYMTLGSFLILARKSDLSPMRMSVGQSVFSLPPTFRLADFIRGVIWFTLAIEAAGAVVLYFIFRQAGVDAPLWNAVFHSISAFCTAGFGLHNNSFESFTGNTGLNMAIAALSYMGAVGFIVFMDMWRMLRGKVKHVTLTTRIILAGTFWLTVAGTALLFVFEPTVQAMASGPRLMASFFQCMTAITTVGFNTISIAELSKASVLLIVVLMVIGSSPSGTGGGVKVTTLSAVLGTMRSSLRGDSQVRFWERTIPYERIMIAFASLGFYILALVIGGYLLEMTETTPFEMNLFEAASALGTVGLSMGITAGLSTLGKVIIMSLMFCGRVGPLTFGSAIMGRLSAQPVKPDGDLAV